MELPLIAKKLARRLVMLVSCCTWQIANGQVILVTELEAQASRNAPEQLIPKASPVPGAPEIALEAPDISLLVPSPTAVRIKFRPTAPAVIRPESFRVLYGFLRVDITDRITGAAQVTGTGIDVNEAELPSGSHSLLVKISDSFGRLGQRWFKFVVK